MTEILFQIPSTSPIDSISKMYSKSFYFSLSPFLLLLFKRSLFTQSTAIVLTDLPAYILIYYNAFSSEQLGCSV